MDDISITESIAEENDAHAEPLHVQRVEQALSLSPLLRFIEHVISSPRDSTDGETTDGDTDKELDGIISGAKVYNGVGISKGERKADKSRVYNFSKTKKSRKWLKNLLLSDSSEDEELEPSKTEILNLMKVKKYEEECRQNFYKDKELQQYQYYSVGLLSQYDRYFDHQRSIIGPKKKQVKEQKKLEKKLMRAKIRELKKQANFIHRHEGDGSRPGSGGSAAGTGKKVKKATPEQLAARRRRLWVMIAKKEIPRAHKQKASARKELMTNLKKVAKECQKESRRSALQSQKIMKEGAVRARRLSKEMLVYWKRFEKVEKEHRRRAEKEAQEQMKMDMEIREMKRQQRKLNFLITQTELYAHFMARKMTGETNSDKQAILRRLEEKPSVSSQGIPDDYDSEVTKSLAIQHARKALAMEAHRKKSYDLQYAKHKSKSDSEEEALSLANPAISTDVERPQPKIFQGKLKGYQLKGMNWLANLYDQGINGILADEMGLGKTVQTIALLAHLAETQNIWGPFLVVAPASTLHNWQQELSRFLPALKVVPYWGNTQDRKILRKFWKQDHLYTKDASFHVVITSYQLVIQDVKYFQRIKWHYMVLDEAQAIKSTNSVRWKILLGFNCRNRMLLTGTPIQNSMQELWALLHFIMPTMFDCHEEFSDWFSKDIENHAENKSGIDENQLSRLHMILKPFMLRRVKKDVENELSDKIEILVYCPLTTRQKLLYQGIKNKISIEDLLQSASASTTHQAQNIASSLMNLVMQFRKVCNHPELFERREITSPFYFCLPPYVIPKLIYREGVLDYDLQSKKHILHNRFSIFNPEHIYHSLFPKHSKADHVHTDCTYSFTRFIDLSPAELFSHMLQGLIVRWLSVFMWLKSAYRLHHKHVWGIEAVSTRYLTKDSLVLWPEARLSGCQVQNNVTLQGLLFTGPNSSFYTHGQQTLHYMPETIAHCKLRLRRHSGQIGRADDASVRSPPCNTSITLGSPHRGNMSPPGSPTSMAIKHKSHSQDLLELKSHRHIKRSPRVIQNVPLNMPTFLYNAIPKTKAQPLKSYCSDRSATWDEKKADLCGTLNARNSLLYGSPEVAEQVRWHRYYLYPSQPHGLYGVQPFHGYSGVFVPNKETLVTDAGKLYVLDTLLQRLKSDGHRVLIYSQMTRMIDILEEYMWHRKHTYIRLDGSSKISDRRDMVADFQSRSDIFVFLLSTRAGGLGINLTAADTVIFYDSDWNPTVDQQAMDRAHRLGQTKQVTVYRLICKHTIEERILQRAKEKSEIQRMVIQGGNFRTDVLKPKEVVSLLLDDDEMERKLHYKQDEKRPDLAGNKDKKRKSYQKTGRRPGRPPKKKKLEDEQNTTIAAPHEGGESTPSILSVDSTSAAASPLSVLSVSSEPAPQPPLSLNVCDDLSNDSPLVVDDARSTTPIPAVPGTATPSKKRGTGRPRGRPRGSGVGRRPRGRGSVQKALSAAEAAGAAAAKNAALKAYGYSMTAGIRGGTSSARGTTGGRGTRGGTSGARGTSGTRGAGGTRGGHHGSSPRNTATSPHAAARPPSSSSASPTSPRGFYSQRP